MSKKFKVSKPKQSKGYSIDLTGKVFDRLTVIGSAEKKGDWKCLCECGRVVIVSGTSLRSGTHMCHHCATNQKDLIGQQFGKLTVTSRVGTDHNDHVVWGCRCTCGRLTKTTTHQLTKGHTRSCGRPECKFDLQKGEASFNALFDSYRRRAASKGLAFEPSHERFRELTQEPCYYCGDLPSQKSNPAKKTNGHFIYNGIDRKDNNLGYVEGNMVPCCGGCNRAKKTGRAKDHLDWIDSLTTPQSNQAINLVVENQGAGA